MTIFNSKIYNMKDANTFSRFHYLLLVMFFLFGLSTQAQTVRSIRGIVLDESNKKPLAFATVAIEGSNVATVSNSEGVFLLKFSEELIKNNLVISFIGYEKKVYRLAELKEEENLIFLSPTSVSLSEVSVFPSDPDLLIRAIMSRRDQNYGSDNIRNLAFYRETIKKGRNYVSLTEAVVDVYKPGYQSSRNDQVSLVIGRKSTDYEKVDTLVFKLQGGPLSALMLDIMKDPYLLFDNEQIGSYNFEISTIAKIDDRHLYVLSFKPAKGSTETLFYGDLYVDMASLAVTSASFNMDVSNRAEAARLFIKKKPFRADVYPTKATYLVNYREKDGIWNLAYVRADVSFKINWRRRLFNSNYYTSIELAITDRVLAENKPFRPSDRIKMSVIMEDAVEGFSDDNFWGDYNLIEPDQPIEDAIKRIQKQLEK